MASTSNRSNSAVMLAKNSVRSTDALLSWAPVIVAAVVDLPQRLRFDQVAAARVGDQRRQPGRTRARDATRAMRPTLVPETSRTSLGSTEQPLASIGRSAAVQQSRMPASIARWPSRSPSHPTRVPHRPILQRSRALGNGRELVETARQRQRRRRGGSPPACRAAGQRQARCDPSDPRCRVCARVRVALGQVGHAALAGPEPEDVVPRRRVAQRAHVVAAVGDGQHVRGQADGRTTAAAARGARQIERIAGGAEHIVERVRAEPELGHVGLADDDACRQPSSCSPSGSRRRGRSVRAGASPWSSAGL